MKRHVCFRLLASSSILILSSRTEGSWDKSNVGRLCGLEPPDDDDDDDDDVAVDDAAAVDDGVAAVVVDAMVGGGWMVGMQLSWLVCWCSLLVARCSLFVARCRDAQQQGELARGLQALPSVHGFACCRLSSNRP